MFVLVANGIPPEALAYQLAVIPVLVLTARFTGPYPQRVPGTVDNIVGMTTFAVTDPDAEFPQASVTFTVYVVVTIGLSTKTAVAGYVPPVLDVHE